MYYKGIFIFISLYLGLVSSSLACCGENDYRLYPMGESNGHIIFLECDFYRNCKMAKAKDDKGRRLHGFFLRGTVRLVITTSKGKLNHLALIDSVNIQECDADYASFYEKTKDEVYLDSVYAVGLNYAKLQKPFQIAKTKEISFNDTLHTKVVEDEVTFNLKISYKNLKTVELGMEDIISCMPKNVAEARVYETKSYTLTVIRLRCRKLTEEVIARNKKRFENIETAYWKEQAQWHGVARDYWVVKKR